jgi:hypothetical protein
MQRTVGREDRLVRSGIALSLAIMAGFGVAASGSVGIAVVLFAALGAYFLLTAAMGWDPLYARMGIDTRHAAPQWPADDQAASGAPALEIDLRDSGVQHRSGGRTDNA